MRFNPGCSCCAQCCGCESPPASWDVNLDPITGGCPGFLSCTFGGLYTISGTNCVYLGEFTPSSTCLGGSGELRFLLYCDGTDWILEVSSDDAETNAVYKLDTGSWDCNGTNSMDLFDNGLNCGWPLSITVAP